MEFNTDTALEQREALGARTQKRAPKKPGANREAILSAAAAVFLERGYHDASLDDIAQRVGVSKPTLYYHVGSKEQLLAACLRESIAELTNLLATIEGEGLSGADQLERATQYCVEIACTEFGRCVVRIPDYVLTECRTEIQTIKKTVARNLAAIHLRGLQDGSLKGRDPRLIGQLLRGLINSVGFWFSPGGEWTSQMIAQTIVELAIKPMRTDWTRD